MNQHFMKVFLYGLMLAVVPCSCLPFMRAVDDRPMVTVNEGIILGLEENQGGLDMFTYRGIPYAQPPVQELRFMPPVPVESWDYELDASILPHSCPQLLTGREDCLYLNVYTPANIIEPLAVMVFIHGGGFVLGSTGAYDKNYRLVQHDVIVVTIQYRIGILGFFSTDDEVVPGNQGLKDQTLALKWIKDNIASFGGDTNRITLFGHSAGSASTHYQVITSYAADLFDRYILISGNALTPWAVGRDYYEVSRDLARRNDCPDNSTSSEILTCLQGVKNYIVLNDMQTFYIDWNFQPFRFAPRVDGDYILDDPAQLVKSGLYAKIPCIMGTVRNEMALETGELYAIPSIMDNLVNNFDVNGQPSLMLYDDEDPLNTATLVYNYYVGGIDIDDDDADNLTTQYTDLAFHVPLDWLVQRQADVVQTFNYEFDYRGTWGLTDVYANMGLNITSAADWIAHGDDLRYIFEEGDTLTDILMSCLYSTYFTNFAKFGDPTPGSNEFCIDASVFTKWEQSDGTTLKHLSIIPEPAMVEDARQDVRTFWESLPLRINSILQS